MLFLRVCLEMSPSIPPNPNTELWQPLVQQLQLSRTEEAFPFHRNNISIESAVILHSESFRTGSSDNFVYLTKRQTLNVNWQMLCTLNRVLGMK